MKYHKVFENYLTFLEKIFPTTKNIELIYRNFEVLKSILKNNNESCVLEINYDVDISEQRLRIKLRELEKQKVIDSKMERKPNCSYTKKYYSVPIDEEIIKRFEKYIKCSKCGQRLGKLGGVLHHNIQRKEPRIFCSKQCRNKWIYKKQR